MHFLVRKAHILCARLKPQRANEPQTQVGDRMYCRPYAVANALQQHGISTSTHFVLQKIRARLPRSCEAAKLGPNPAQLHLLCDRYKWLIRAIRKDQQKKSGVGSAGRAAEGCKRLLQHYYYG